jgi:hypothetical protein
MSFITNRYTIGGEFDCTNYTNLTARTTSIWLHELHQFDCTNYTNLTARTTPIWLHELHQFDCTIYTNLTARTTPIWLHELQQFDCTNYTNLTARTTPIWLHELDPLIINVLYFNLFPALYILLLLKREQHDKEHQIQFHNNFMECLIHETH